MKRRSFLILIIFITIASIVKSQDLFMYEENGSKVFFHKVDSVIVLKFKPNTSYINKADVVAKINPSFQLLSPNLDRYIIPFNKEVKVDLSFIKDYKYVVYANPSLTRGNGIIEVPTDKVLVKIMDNVQLEQILKSLNINYDRYKQLGHDKNSFLI